MASKHKLKMKDKVKDKAISQPVNFEHTAHMDKDNSRSWITATQPQVPISPNDDIRHHDAGHINTALTRTLEQFKQEFMQEAVESIKAEIKDSVREVFKETLTQYKLHNVVVKDDGPTYSACDPVCTPGSSHETQSDSKTDAGSNNNNDTKKMKTEQLANLYDDHDYTNIPFDKPVLVRRNTTPWLRKSESLTEQPLERRATVTSVPYGRRTAADDRECLANAVQSHVVAMVNNVLFTETDLPDLLNEQGFLTEEECYTMRKLPNRKDRIRTLLSVMKGRDKKTIEGFLKYIQKYNPDIVGNVYKTYNANKSNGMRCKLCAFCKMKTNVDIKYVVDSIWSIFAIPDGLYNEIIVSQKPAGAQEVKIYWGRLADTCNSHNTDLRTKAMEALVQCLAVKNYSHIANTLTSQLLNRDSQLKCRCKVVPLRNRESFICSTATSLSPRSTPRTSCEVLAENGDLTRPKLSVMSDLSASLDSIYEEVQNRSNMKRPNGIGELQPPPLPPRLFKASRSVSLDRLRSNILQPTHTGKPQGLATPPPLPPRDHSEEIQYNYMASSPRRDTEVSHLHINQPGDTGKSPRLNKSPQLPPRLPLQHGNTGHSSTSDDATTPTPAEIECPVEGSTPIIDWDSVSTLQQDDTHQPLTKPPPILTKPPPILTKPPPILTKPPPILTKPCPIPTKSSSVPPKSPPIPSKKPPLPIRKLSRQANILGEVEELQITIIESAIDVTETHKGTVKNISLESLESSTNDSPDNNLTQQMSDNTLDNDPSQQMSHKQGNEETEYDNDCSYA